jgi:thiosulfate dehydrogenase
MKTFKQWVDGLSHTRRFHPSWIILVVSLSLAYAVIMLVPAALVGETSRAQVHENAQKNLLANSSMTTPGAPMKPLTAGSAPSAGNEPASGQRHDTAHPQRISFQPPAADSIPSGPFGDSVRLGRNIFVDTQTYAKRYVGNGLNCANCHLDAGRKANVAPLWGAYSMFPAYRDKNKKVNSFEDRLAGCFRFSMNGKAPPFNSPEMLALTSYSFWLAHGAPTGVELKGRGYPKLATAQQTPDAQRGKQVFDTNCALCHGADGQGTRQNGRYVFPPLWGPHSFNAGAGMSQLNNAAGFIKANMPLSKGDSLTEQQAWDVAKYMDSQARPPDPRGQKAATGKQG